jgi:transposase InsO family protein
MALRSAVQSIVIQHRWRYGYRRVTVELRTQGMVANHKRIARIMREDNLLTVREQWFQPPWAFASCRPCSPELGGSNDVVWTEPALGC